MEWTAIKETGLQTVENVAVGEVRWWHLCGNGTDSCLKWNSRIHFLNHSFINICWLSFDSISSPVTFNLGTSSSLTPCHVLVSEQLKRINTNQLYNNFLCSRLVCSGYRALFSQIDSCQPPVVSNALSSLGCTLAVSEYKVPFVGFLGRDLNYTCAGFFGVELVVRLVFCFQYWLEKV